MTPDLLETVVAAARRSADERQRRVPLPADPGRHPPGGSRFRTALASTGVRVIAECKRRSPSRGVLRRQYDPVSIARGYAGAGAAAISVLTEPTFFDGSLDHLAAVRRAVDVPILRKDFVVTEYQILEAKAAGADAVLLIVAALPRARLQSLLAYAGREGMAALVEVHGEDELEVALEAGADIVGVNSRNLRTLEVSPAVFDDLAHRLPAGVLAVAESGLRTGDDLKRLARMGYRGFLVGERLMSAADPGVALGELLAAAGSPPEGARP